VKGIHFDNASSTPLSKGVQEAMKRGDFISPFAPYGDIRPLNEAWEKLETLFPTKGEGSLFFAPSRQAAADAIYRFVFEEWGRGFGKNHFLTSHVEEAPAMMTMAELEAWGGKGTIIDVDENGLLRKEKLQAALTPRSSLLTLSLGNGLLGTIHPLEELFPLLEERSVLLHLDLSHVIGKIEIDLQALKADFITFSAETLHAPRGAAILWSKRPLKSGHFLFGSEKNALGLLDVPRFLALGTALEEGKEHLSTLQMEGSLLREHFETELQKAIVDCKILFKETERLPTTSVISFPGVMSEPLLYLLAEKGLHASMGGETFQMIGHLLKACHLPPKIALSALSFTLSRMNTTEEVDQAVKIIQEAYQQLQKLSLHLL